MNSKQRLDAFFTGQPVDRLPNLTIVGSMVTQYNGIDIETYCKDSRAMVQAAIAAARDLSLDFVQIASDLAREAEGYGSQVTFSKTKLPTVTGLRPGGYHTDRQADPQADCGHPRRISWWRPPPMPWSRKRISTL